MSESSTGLLYIAIFIITSVLGTLSQRHNNGRVVFIPVFFLSAFIIHWFFGTFTNIGSDYNHYINIIAEEAGERMETGNELGFNALCCILYNLLGNAHISLFFIRSLEYFILYYTFWRLRYRVSLGYAIMAYNMIIYVYSFLLVSMHFAVVALFLSYVYLVEFKEKKALVMLIVACSVHSSSLLLIPVFVIYLFFIRKNKKVRLTHMIFLGGAAVAIVVAFSMIYDYAMANIPMFIQYAEYAFKDEQRGSGLTQYVFFIPIFYFAYQLYRSNYDYRIKYSSIVFSVMGLSYALLGYKIEVLVRINMSFLMIYSCIVPMALQHKRVYEKSSKGMSYIADASLWFLYLAVRGFLYFEDYMSVETGGDLYSYSLFNPFN